MFVYFIYMIILWTRSNINFPQRCRVCVVDMDYHCLVSMNCVGAGNNRIHFVFLLLVFMVSALYLVLAIYVEHTVHCPNSHGMVISFAVSFY